MRKINLLIQKIDYLLKKEILNVVTAEFYALIFVVELPEKVSDSWCKRVNMFLRGTEKDTLLLKQFVSGIGLRIPQQAGRELYRKWSDIYDYNLTLPDSLKIRVIGVDTDFEGKIPISRDSAMINSKKNTITLFNLAQNGSPGLVSGSSKYLKTKVNFFNQQIFPYDEHLAMSDFIQYIIFIRNSEAITAMY